MKAFDFKKLFRSVTIKKQNFIFSFNKNIKDDYDFIKVSLRFQNDFRNLERGLMGKYTWLKASAPNKAEQLN